MSFDQFRTNPGQAVNKFKGRSSTPKAWPSTLVSAWTNGGLFGGGGPSDTWILIASSSSAQWNSTGKTQDGMFNNYDGGTQSDGSMMVSIEGNGYNRLISVTDKGVIRDNAFVGPEGSQYYYGANSMQGFAYDETSDVIYSSIQAVVTAISAYAKYHGVRVMPGTNVDTTSTTITDFKLTDPRGQSWSNDRTNACYIIDASTGKFMLIGSLKAAYPGVIFGQVVGGSIVWGQSNRADGYTNWINMEFRCAAIGDSGRFYYYGNFTDNFYNPKLTVVCSSDTSGSASFGNMSYKGFNGNTQGAFNAVNMGTYSGEDQFALAHIAQMSGAPDFGITIHTPNDRAVQYQKYIYGTGLSAEAQPGIQLLAKDSAGNLYALTRRGHAAPRAGELILVKLDSTLTVQWIRIINASTTTAFNGTNYDFYRATGITISNDDNYVTVMAELDFNSANSRKLFMSRFPTDGSGYGALSDSGAAINIGGTPDVDASGRSDWTGMSACYIRYYDNGDASNTSLVNVSSLSGSVWSTGTATSDVSSSHTARTPPAYNHTNQANWYGSYPLESWA
jgi:hypothetical protein